MQWALFSSILLLLVAPLRAQPTTFEEFKEAFEGYDRFYENDTFWNMLNTHFWDITNIQPETVDNWQIDVVVADTSEEISFNPGLYLEHENWIGNRDILLGPYDQYYKTSQKTERETALLKKINRWKSKLDLIVGVAIGIRTQWYMDMKTPTVQRDDAIAKQMLKKLVKSDYSPAVYESFLNFQPLDYFLPDMMSGVSKVLLKYTNLLLAELAPVKPHARILEALDGLLAPSQPYTQLDPQEMAECNLAVFVWNIRGMFVPDVYPFEKQRWRLLKNDGSWGNTYIRKHVDGHFRFFVDGHIDDRPFTGLFDSVFDSVSKCLKTTTESELSNYSVHHKGYLNDGLYTRTYMFHVGDPHEALENTKKLKAVDRPYPDCVQLAIDEGSIGFEWGHNSSKCELIVTNETEDRSVTQILRDTNSQWTVEEAEYWREVFDKIDVPVRAPTGYTAYRLKLDNLLKELNSASFRAEMQGILTDSSASTQSDAHVKKRFAETKDNMLSMLTWVRKKQSEPLRDAIKRINDALDERLSELYESLEREGERLKGRRYWEPERLNKSLERDRYWERSLYRMLIKRYLDEVASTGVDPWSSNTTTPHGR